MFDKTPGVLNADNDNSPNTNGFAGADPVGEEVLGGHNAFPFLWTPKLQIEGEKHPRKNITGMCANA